MLKVLGRRVLWTIPLLLIVSLFSFVLANLTPGSTGEAILGNGATPDNIARINSELGLDKPVMAQYGDWLTGAVHGDLGNSLVDNQEVTTLMASRLGPTLSLTLLTLIGVVVLGVILGVVAAMRGGWLARLIETLSTVLRGAPQFWLAMILISIFAVQIRAFPASGYIPFQVSFSLWIQSLILPVIALGVGQLALIAIVVRGEMLTAMRSDYVKSLRANGLSTRSILFKHCLKNIAGPVLTNVSLLFVGLLGGTVLIEQVFGIAGLGNQMVRSVSLHDLPVIQAVVVFYTLVVVAVFILDDLLNAWVNPKVRAQ